MRTGLFIVFVFLNFGLCAQDHSSYPYVVVPDQFEFQKSEDQFQLNSLIQFLLNKQGFQAFLNSQKTKELIQKPCQSLDFVLKKHRHFLRTKLQFHLVNCERDTLFKSEVGVSFLKDYKKAYHESIRDAFASYSDSIYQLNLENYKRLKGLSVALKSTKKTQKTEAKDENIPQFSGQAIVQTYSNKAGLQIAVENIGQTYKAVVLSNKFGYKKGQVLFELQPTSVPSIYKTIWFDAYGNPSNTVANLSTANEIHIDLMTVNGIEIQIFKGIQ